MRGYFMLLVLTQKYTAITQRLTKLKNLYIVFFLSTASFLPNYYRVSDLMWQDGLLIDFLQKKVADKWVRRFLVCSSYLFSERVLFKFVVRFYIDAVVWPGTWSALFEPSNVAQLLSFTVAAIALLLLLINLNYIYFLLL